LRPRVRRASFASSDRISVDVVSVQLQETRPDESHQAGRGLGAGAGTSIADEVAAVLRTKGSGNSSPAPPSTPTPPISPQSPKGRTVMTAARPGSHLARAAAGPDAVLHGGGPPLAEFRADPAPRCPASSRGSATRAPNRRARSRASFRSGPSRMTQPPPSPRRPATPCAPEIPGGPVDQNRFARLSFAARRKTPYGTRSCPRRTIEQHPPRRSGRSFGVLRGDPGPSSANEPWRYVLRRRRQPSPGGGSTLQQDVRGQRHVRERTVGIRRRTRSTDRRASRPADGRTRPTPQGPGLPASRGDISSPTDDFGRA